MQINVQCPLCQAEVEFFNVSTGYHRCSCGAVYFSALDDDGPDFAEEIDEGIADMIGFGEDGRPLAPYNHSDFEICVLKHVEHYGPTGEETPEMLASWPELADSWPVSMVFIRRSQTSFQNLH